MKIFFKLVWLIGFLILVSCQAIENKSQQVLKKENEKLSKFLNQPESELKIVMGKPDKIIIDDKGTRFLIYVSTKYKLSCERKFEINQYEMVVGFSSKGCF